MRARFRRQFRLPRFEELERRYLLSISAAGSNFIVNSALTTTHANAAVAENASGDFVIAWSSLNQVSGTSNEDIYATRYDSNGNALDVPGQPAGTTEFLVNTYTTNAQDHPSVAMAADGSFVIVWDSVQSGSLLSIHGQRFDSSGNPVGSEFEVNTFTAHSTNVPAVAMSTGGEFVVTWMAYDELGDDTDDIYAQLYNANGTKLGGEFLVNTTTANSQQDPTVAMDAEGDFVIAWQSDAADGSTFDVFAQRYNASGAAQGGQFQVNTYTPSNQRYASAAMDAAGDFVIAWDSYGEDGSSDGIYARTYNSAGTATSGEFLVNTSYTSSSQQFPAAAMNSSGAFAIAWQSAGENGVSATAYGIDLQQYAANGTPIGGEISVSNPGQSQTLPALGIDVNGGLVVAWQGVQSDGTTVDIMAEHDPPAPSADSYSTTIGQALTVNAAGGVLANDGFVGSPITAQLATPPTQGSVTLNSDGSFTYTPDAGFAGVDTFTYEVAIGQQISSPASVSIAVVDAASLATITTRLLSNAQAGASGDVAKVSGILAQMNSDGSFIGYDYSGTTATSATDYEQHATNLAVLANAYQYNSPTNTWYQNATLLADILTSFGYLANTAVGDANVPNWYDTEISMPNDLWPAMILMQNQIGSSLTAALLARYFDSSSRPVWNVTETDGENHGANLTMRATAAVAEGALEGDGVAFTTRLAQVVALVTADLNGSSPVGDGLQSDDSEHQHDGSPILVAQLASGSYGVDYADSLAKLLPWLFGTSYQFSSAADNLVVGYVLDGQQWLMRGDTIEATSLGRAISRPGDSISSYADEMLDATNRLMALGIRTTELQAFSTSLSTGVPEALTGNRAFWTSDYMVQQRPGYMAAVRMISDRTIRPETLNGEGLQNFYLGDGVTMIYVTGEEYGSASGQEIFPVWNWQRLPGTTVEQAATMPVSAAWDTNDGAVASQFDGLGSFVGSDSDGTYGLAAMDYGRSNVNVTAHKSWFYFDEGFVALGADINDSAGTGEVDTTLNQSLLTSNVTVEQAGGTQTSFGNGTTEDFTNPNWILQGGIGYVLLGPNGNLVVQAQSQTGTWQSIGLSTGTVTDNVFTAYIDQGVNPSNASYAYAVLPGATATSLDTYAGSNSPLLVLSNTDSIQAVQETSEGVTEIAFYQAGSLAIGNGMTVSVDEPSLVTVRQMGGSNVEVSVSDPTQSLASLHVTITGEYGGSGATWQPSQGTTQLAITLPTGDDAGESVVIPLTNLSPAITLGSGSATFIQGGSAVAIAPDVSIADAGIGNLQSATVTISNLLDGSAEALAVSGMPGGGLIAGTNITASYSAANGTLTLSGVDSLADYQLALDRVTYADSSLTANTTTRTLQIEVVDANDATDAVEQNVSFDVAPTIVGAFVSGTTWSSTYLGILASAGVGSSTLGFELASGTSQLSTTLPWSNANEIAIAFSGPVTVSQTSLTLYNGSNAAASVASYSYNSSTYVATWQFSTSLVPGEFLINLASASVTDTAGAALDGAWSTGVSTFAAGSGNGAPGSDFNFFFNALPGDASKDGQVNGTDLLFMKLDAGSQTTASNYRYDLHGSGMISSSYILTEKLNAGLNTSMFAQPNEPAQSMAQVAGGAITAAADPSQVFPAADGGSSAPSAAAASLALSLGPAGPLPGNTFVLEATLAVVAAAPAPANTPLRRAAPPMAVAVLESPASADGSTSSLSARPARIAPIGNQLNPPAIVDTAIVLSPDDAWSPSDRSPGRAVPSLPGSPAAAFISKLLAKTREDGNVLGTETRSAFDLAFNRW